ncbi:VOC family protein [Enterococcus sp. LJL98]
MFSNNIQLMIYVDDVAKARDFWLKLDFVLIEEQEMDGTLVVEMALNQTSGVHFVLYDREFIEQHSPEVATNSPSLMFFAEDIFVLYKKMEAQGVQLGELIQLSDKYVFNFADLDGNYFAVSGIVTE